jgi:hypothetical protein
MLATMWSDLLRYPSGDPQAQVFWRRRMSVLAVLAVLGLLLVVLFARGGGSSSVTPTAAERPVPDAGGAPPPSDTSSLPASPSPSATPSGSASPSSSASPATTPADRSTTCTPGSMALRVAPDADSYAAGKEPSLTLSVVDIGTAPCVVDLGNTATSISVLSGGKAVWTSAACKDPVARPVNLTPSSAQTLQVGWNRTANVGACAAPKTLPAGTYEVVAAVGKAVVYGGAITLA